MWSTWLKSVVSSKVLSRGSSITVRMARLRYLRTDTGFGLQTELACPTNQFGLRLHPELLVDPYEVTLDGSLADEQPVGDRLRRLAPRRQQGDLAFAPAQRVGAEG